MHTPPPKSKQIALRIFIALAGAVMLGAFAVVSWFVIGFELIDALLGKQGELLGYFQIALLPIAAAVGVLAGLVTGLFGQPRKVFVRWLLASVVVALLGAAVNGLLLLAL